ncbi:hypothetical protein UFOVP1229_119 [uncultured Caudovirales phage]|uniref:Uncharacterized protein n=1 Tax=uncultured Caudovirales phage TaxID=2100421 RepID=A0A6J5RBK4_9CAUD|nr:hypothetical protein UFOVP1229_119 [uncultured Caudovirales phage]
MNEVTFERYVEVHKLAKQRAIEVIDAVGFDGSAPVELLSLVYAMLSLFISVRKIPVEPNALPFMADDVLNFVSEKLRDVGKSNDQPIQ